MDELKKEHETARKQNAQPEAKPATIAEYIPAEINLEIGYFSAGYKRLFPGAKKQNKKGEVVEVVPSKKVLTFDGGRVVEIIPTHEFGFPNTEDQDYYRAFQKIFEEAVRDNLIEYVIYRDERGRERVRLNRSVRFSTRKFIHYAGREESADEWSAARTWIKRQRFTGLLGQIKLANSPDEFDLEPLIKRFYLRGARTDEGEVADMNYVMPADWFVWNNYHHLTKPIDLNFHHSLGTTALGKALYPILDVGWFAASGNSYKKSYRDLTTLLGIQAFKYESRVRQQLDPAHEVLREKEFLARWEYRKAKDGIDFVIEWWPGPKYFRDQEARAERRQIALQVPLKPDSSVDESVLPFPKPQPDQVLNDRQEHLLSEIVAVIGEHSRPYGLKLIRKLPEGRIWGLLSETRQARLEKRLKGTPAAFFIDLAQRTLLSVAGEKPSGGSAAQAAAVG